MTEGPASRPTASAEPAGGRREPEPAASRGPSRNVVLVCAFPSSRTGGREDARWQPPLFSWCGISSSATREHLPFLLLRGGRAAAWGGRRPPSLQAPERDSPGR